MGEMCGKCSFEDDIDIFGLEYILNSNIYVGRNIIPLKFTCYKDLIPYFAYIVSVGNYDNKSASSIRLSNESYVDIQERESLELYKRECVRYINKCKRNKEKIDLNHFDTKYNQYCKDIYKEIIIRLVDKPKEFTLNGIHTKMAERYRKLLYDKMIKYGYDEQITKRWVYKTW